MTETLPTPNLPLLRKVLDHVDAHPEEWVQSSWAIRGEALDRVLEYHQVNAVPACGTAYCIAGHAVTMAGHDVLWLRHSSSTAATLTNGEAVGDAAQRELGLTNTEADHLFSGCNDRRQVQYAAERIARRAGEVL